MLKPFVFLSVFFKTDMHLLKIRFFLLLYLYIYVWLKSRCKNKTKIYQNFRFTIFKDFINDI